MIRTVVVGSGAAGAALAARLSEHSDRLVTLVEAGGSDSGSAELRDGSRLAAALPEHPANWAYEAELVPGKPHIVPRGRVLGGSTAINGGYFVRARPGDFAHWAALGGPAWSYERVLPLLAALECDLDRGGEPGHGADGPMLVRRPPQTGPLISAFAAAARELGFAEEPDKNTTESAPGVGAVPSNIVDGERWSTARAYLGGAADARAGTVTGTGADPGSNARLTVLTDARVTRVLVERGDARRGDPALRAVGVELSRGGSSAAERIAADEVVLCAGAIASPQLLLLSGIGPREQLDEHGIPVLADLPVGEGFSDHPNLTVDWLPKRPLLDPRQRFVFPTALNFDSSGASGRFPDGDLEILLSVKPVGDLFGEPGDGAALPGGAAPGDGAWPAAGPATMQLFVALQAPRSRGRLSLRSADPFAPPRIEYRYLEHDEDRARLRIAVRTAASMLRGRAFAELFAGFSPLEGRPLTSETLADDAALDAWIRARLGTAIHMCGTAAMGGVVDGAGRVQGVDGLRVADTSILPRVPSRGPANTAVLIGELIARQMMAD